MTPMLAAAKGAPMVERWRGIYTILLTPFLEGRSLDEASLWREHDLAELDAALELARPDLVAEVVVW
jgi:hypothetical protein